MFTDSPNGLQYFQFESFQSFPNIRHGIFTRLGGSSAGQFQSLNVSPFIGDNPADVLTNREKIADALEINLDKTATVQQVHGNTAWSVNEEWHQIACDLDAASIAGDAMITDTAGCSLMIIVADCVPILLCSSEKNAVAIIHAGWRGTAAEIVYRTTQKFMSTFNVSPEDVYAGIGPSIGPCCYEVSEDVLSTLKQTEHYDPSSFTQDPDTGSLKLNLWQANAHQLRLAGISPEYIETAEICTSCNTGKFYSHRREHGQTGRFAAVIGIRQ